MHLPRLAATWLWTKAVVQKHPQVVINTLVGGVVCATADGLAQRLENNSNSSKKKEEQQQQLQPGRMITAAAIGAICTGFVYPFGYAQLDALFGGAKNISTILQKSIVEILTVGVFVNSASMQTRGLVAGRSWGTVTRHVVTELPKVTWNDGRVWLPYNILAFAWIPAPVRPLTTAAMEAGWQTYMSLRSNAYEQQQQQQQQQQ